jgi:hypothetical protein
MSGQLLLKKTGGAIIADAQPTRAFMAYENFALLGLATPLLKIGRKWLGGLVVGGALYVYPDRIEFKPNALNEALHAGDVSWSIPVGSIKCVKWRFGMVTGIVDILYGDNGLSHQAFRCYGSKALTSFIQGVALPAS